MDELALSVVSRDCLVLDLLEEPLVVSVLDVSEDDLPWRALDESRPPVLLVVLVLPEVDERSPVLLLFIAEALPEAAQLASTSTPRNV